MVERHRVAQREPSHPTILSAPFQKRTRHLLVRGKAVDVAAPQDRADGRELAHSARHQNRARFQLQLVGRQGNDRFIDEMIDGPPFGVNVAARISPTAPAAIMSTR